MSFSFPLASTDRHAVELTGIARRFGLRWALRGVSLRVRPGEAVAITGHNGCGKSTLLRIIATALRATRGEGAVYGHDIRRASAAVRGHVALLAATSGVYDDLTAEENLVFATRMAGLRATPRDIAAALARVSLAHVAHERVRTFSTGMQRRVALARVLLQSPPLLLLDEPFNSFDAEGVALVNEMMRESAARGGAVIVVAHDLERADGGIDRVLRMSAGAFVVGDDRIDADDDGEESLTLVAAGAHG